MRKKGGYWLGLLLLCAAFIACKNTPKNINQTSSKTSQIGHIIVIYLENHSFDNLYGQFPGADGIAQAEPARTLQIDAKGKTFGYLPEVGNGHDSPAHVDTRFSNLPNAPFVINDYIPPDQRTPDLTHRFYQHQLQINGGRMNRFADISSAGALAMGYYDARNFPLWQYAQRYTLADHFFQAAYGGSFLNHLWLVCACTPRLDSAPASLRAQIGNAGELLHDGAVTPDGYAVNTLQPANKPHADGVAPEKYLPPLTQPTIGDRLSDKGVDWAWYAGGWNDAQSGRADRLFQFHHQPFVYFQRYAKNTDERKKHLKDEEDFIKSIESGNLPAVSFYKPIGNFNEHPGYADVLSGEQHIAQTLKRIESSPLWKDSVVIITYDEYGGFWDHVPPPKGDRWGPGSRVPALIISPFAKRGFIDHTVYDTTSILKLIETRFGLQALGDRDAAANNLLNTLQF
ncbi:alkaline phosphatase family protein [Candidatus Methylospira mobilis]|uniref:alkaline phosphatase family protein n=1 Tax=Candidatus Methylospira mobilis TaxID=1808979 RepID=UPI0028F0E6A5|nr:alkaline phosphatase family protein [Candidatus Methylospira mobilis]WNV06307.1 alkaline phosphatase family protein [Candidatus Methylospira mobilis]